MQSSRGDLSTLLVREPPVTEGDIFPWVALRIIQKQGRRFDPPAPWQILFYAVLGSPGIECCLLGSHVILEAGGLQCIVQLLDTGIGIHEAVDDLA